MPEAKKTNTLIEKTILFVKTLSFHMKNGTAPFYKMPQAKKTNTLIEKIIPVLKTYKFIWKKGTAPSYKMPEAKKTNTLIEKTILVLKTLSFHMKKRHSTVLQNASSQKNKHFHWKNNSGLKNPINSYEKTAHHRLTKCLKPKKQKLSLKKQFRS